MRAGRDCLVFFVALAACLVVSAGCRRGPDGEALRGELQSRLDQHFQDGLFRVKSLRRLGSAPFRSDNGEHTGLFVYYSARLEFQRDYSLTGWKGLNLGTLAFVLGATESGIVGFRSRGNVAGDVLRVQGRLSYRAQGDGWVRADDVLQRQPEPAAAAQDLRGSGPDGVLRGVRDLLARSPETKHETEDAVIVGELRRAVSRIDLRVAGLEGRLTFGAGPAPGAYHAFGQALSDFASRRRLFFYSYESQGSLENGSRLHDRSLDFGLVQSDVAELLYEGWGREGMFPYRDLRSVASLWPEAVHLVTFERSGIRGVRDLRQRRIAVGRRGSGTRLNAVRIGLAADIEASEAPRVRELGLAEGIAALEAGSVDALFVTEVIPSRALQALAARHDDIRFVSIDTSLLLRLSEQHFAYHPLTVEARTYPRQAEPFETLALTCTLLTSRHVSDESVQGVLELIVDGADELSRRYSRAAFISPETMRHGLAVPLHPAAERFYAEREARADEVVQPASEGATPGA